MVQQIVTLLEMSIQAPPGSIRPESSLQELNGWDSMGMVMFVGEAFDRIRAEVGVDDLQTCVTVRDLVALVSRKVPAVPQA